MGSSTPRELSESSLTARPVSTLLRSHGDFRLGHGVTACSTSILTSPVRCDCILSYFSYTLTFTECHLFYVLTTWWYETSSRYFIQHSLFFSFLFWNNCFCICVFEHSVCVRMLLPQHVDEGRSQCGWLRFFSHLYMGPRDRTHVVRLSQQSPLPTKSSH